MLKIHGMVVPSVNENTVITAPQHSMSQLGSVLPRLIAAVASAPVEDGNIIFSKLDIKDGYWRMNVKHGHHLNFAYVLPDKEGERIRLVVPSALQMGWAESPAFFCAATETARDIAEDLANEPMGSLPRHALEDHMLPPNKWPEAGLATTCQSYLKVMEVYVDDFCTMVQTSDVNVLRQVSRSLLHAIHSVFPPMDVSGHNGGDPVSLKKLEEGEGEWDVRKEILGWVFDGARRCIELPVKKLDAIISELKMILRLPAIPYKRFERLVGKLRHAAIGLPAGRGLCAPFNRTVSAQPKMVALGRKGAVHGAFLDWKFLLLDMKRRPTHVNELVPQETSDVGNMDASGIGAGGVWMSVLGAYNNIVWRVEWDAEISRRVVSDKNPRGTITNSDLEMAAILLQWLILEQIATTRHRSALARSDNTPACSWATKMSPKNPIAARLVRALALRQRICQASPMATIHVAGKANDIADIPSRSFRKGHRWNCPSNLDFLIKFNAEFPLKQGACWDLFVINPKLITLVTSVLLTSPLPMDVWQALPPRGRVFGLSGAGTCRSLKMLTRTSPMKSLTTSSGRSPDLRDGSGQVITEEEIKSLVLGSQRRLGPLARPVRWSEGTTLSTERQSGT